MIGIPAKHRRPVLEFLCFGLLLPLGACSAGDVSDPTPAQRADSAGMTVVANTGEDRPLAATFTPLFTMGGDASGPGAFYRVDAQSFDVLPDGRIAVLDRDNFRVALFDAEGTPLSTMGRKGEGPGELSLPVSLVAMNDGTVAVYDYPRRALVRFGPGGETLEQQSLDVPTNGFGLRSTGAGLLVPSRLAERGSDVVAWRLLRLDGSETTELASLVQSAIPAVFYPSCGIRIPSLPPLFTPELVFGIHGNRTTAVSGAEYVVDVFDGRTHSLRIRRDMAPEPADEAAARRWLGEGESWTSSSGECLVGVEELLEARGSAQLVPLLDQVAVSPSGAVWVKRKGPDAATPSIDLFDAAGEYVGTIEGAPFPARILEDGTLLVVEKDELDVERLVAYGVDLPAALLAGGG